MAALDRAIFAGQGRFVAIDAGNTGVATAASWDQAQQWQTTATVATIAGPLHERVLAADVDPADTGAEAEAGEAVAEDLVAWCETRGLAYLVRASGRPGGRHVLVLALDESLFGEWQLLCTRLAAHHEVSVQPRRTLRLLSAPHRLGFAAPVLGGTLRPDDLPAPSTSAMTSSDAERPRRFRRRSTKTTDRDRSAREFGRTLACMRAGWGPGRTWAAVAVAGSKAAEMGEWDWRRWVWCKAVTIVAAEQGLGEDAAWRRFERASPRRARQLGIEAWREQYWQAALEEAERERPRRTHTDRQAAPPRDVADQAAEETEIEAVRTGLRTAADRELALTGRRPQFARSVAAALDALAEYVVRRGGSISDRAWAEAAELDRKTIRVATEFACERGILYRARSYAGGSEDSAAWQPGPAALPEIEQARETSPTRWYTPPARTRGTADPARLRREHARERRVFLLKQVVSSDTEATGETYKQSQHPAAKTLRSLWHQRRWWTSLTPQQQHQRRTQRRRQLGQLHRTERSAWFDWLNRRSVLQFHAERVERNEQTQFDDQVLATAPDLVHLGMRDPAWRTGGSSLSLENIPEKSKSQLVMAA